MNVLSDLLPQEFALGFETGPESLPLETLWLRMGSPPHGITRPVFELMILALYRKGHIHLSVQNKPVDIPTLGLPLTLNSIHIRHGRLIPSNYRTHALRLYKLLFNRVLKEFDIDQQEELWEKTLRNRSRWENGISSFQGIFHTILNQCNADTYDPSRILVVLNRISEFISAIDPDKTALDGLVSIFSRFPAIDDFEAIILHLRRFITLGQSGGSDYLQIRNYIFDVRFRDAVASAPTELSVLSGELESILRLDDEIFLGEHLSRIRQLFESLRSAYTSIYVSAHSAHIREKQTEHLESLEASAEYRLMGMLTGMLPGFLFPGLTAAKRLIESGRKGICNRDPAQELLRSPVCACGFELSATSDKDRAANLGSIMRDEILRVLLVIRSLKPLLNQEHAQDPRLLEVITQTEKMERIDETDVAVVASMLEPGLLTRCNELLGTSQGQHQRQIRDLLTRLQNRVLSKCEARSIILNWIDRDESLGDSELIRFE